jgi:hypothetical protein
MTDVLTGKDGIRPTDARPLVRGNLKDKDVVQHRRRVKKRVEQARPAEAEDAAMLAASGESYAAPLRIEIQTEAPNVRIIWFASPGDGSVPMGPDK